MKYTLSREYRYLRDDILRMLEEAKADNFCGQLDLEDWVREHGTQADKDDYQNYVIPEIQILLQS